MNKTGLADSPLFNKFKKMEGRKQERHDTMTSRNQDKVVMPICEFIQEVGTEASTYRLSKKEKKELYKIIYEFRSKNIRVSENMVVRIALNFLLRDFQRYYKTSLLFMVINQLSKTYNRI